MGDVDMGEAISDLAADAERAALAEAAAMSEADLSSGAGPGGEALSDDDLRDRWNLWAESRGETKVYVPTRSQRILHDSVHLLRYMRGPVGNGKTHACEVDIVVRCWGQSPCADGVIRNRCLFARNTYQQLKQTTFDTWMSLFPATRIALSSPIRGELELQMGSSRSVIELIGFGLDAGSAEASLRSNKLSIGFINEAQYVPWDIVKVILERLGRYPDVEDAPARHRKQGYFKNLGLNFDTNSPVEGSWWWEHAVKNPNPVDEFFIDCPPVFFRTWDKAAGRWVYEENRGQRYESHGVPPAENIENLQEGWQYYWKLLRTGCTDDYIRRNLLNEYGTVLSGTPVYGEFSRRTHVPEHGVAPPGRGRRVFAGIDLGRTPRAVMSYLGDDGGMKVFSVLARDCSTQTFAETVMRPMCALWGVAPGTVTCYIDPAGKNMGEQTDLNSMMILKAAGFDVALPMLKNNDLAVRVETARNALTRLARGGVPYVEIDHSCEELILALAGGYTYAQIKTGNGQSRTSDTPDKGPYSHVANAFEYLTVGMKYGRREEVAGGGGSQGYGVSERFAAAASGLDTGMVC